MWEVWYTSPLFLNDVMEKIWNEIIHEVYCSQLSLIFCLVLLIIIHFVNLHWKKKLKPWLPCSCLLFFDFHFFFQGIVGFIHFLRCNYSIFMYNGTFSCFDIFQFTILFVYFLNSERYYIDSKGYYIGPWIYICSQWLNIVFTSVFL